MGLTRNKCPDCDRLVRQPFETTVTGREVCPDCASALLMGSSVDAITADTGAGFGAWAMMMRKIRRSR